MPKSFLLIFILINSNSIFADQLNLGEDFQKVVRESYGEVIYKTAKPITRSEVLKRASEALNFNYQLTSNNYSSTTINNICNGRDTWLRPYRLYNKVNKTIKAIPYKWGGYFQELSYFQKKLNNEGVILGDVCTCRDAERNYCVVPQSLGLDCSGFVSYAWKTNYFSTSQMHKITRPISWDELQPGDAINNPGKHVILFKRYSKDKNYIHAIESTVRCDGVCETAFRVYDLKREGFSPIRYNNIY